MSRVFIACPRCSEQTPVELTKGVSAQRCEHCGMFLLGAETGVKPEPHRAKRRKKGWRSLASTAASDRADILDPDSLLPNRPTRSLPRWFLPLIFIGTAAIVAITWWHITRERAEGAMSADKDLVLQTSLLNAPLPTPATVPTKHFSDLDPAWSKKVQETADKFLKSTSIEDIVHFIRQPEKFGDSVRATYSAPNALPIGPEGAVDLLYAPPVEKGDQIAMLFFLNRQERIQGLVVVDCKDGILVDWPSLTGQGEMTIEEFLKKRPTQPTLLRVAAKRDDYYNFAYQESTKWICLRLTEFPEDHVFYGYTPVGQAAAEQLSRLPKHDPLSTDPLFPKPQPLTIKAAFREGEQSPNQVEISEVLGNGWYVP